MVTITLRRLENALHHREYNNLISSLLERKIENATVGRMKQCV